jgi:hypothetical protein
MDAIGYHSHERLVSAHLTSRCSDERDHSIRMSQEPTDIGSDDGYGTFVSEKYEEWHAFVVAHLSEPVEESTRDDGTYLTSGHPGEVVVRISEATITVFEYAVKWEDPFTPVVHPRRVGSVVCKRLPERAAMRAVQALIDGARESRQQKFRTCDFCSRQQPPEWMHEPNVCHSCAERQSGAVH